MTAVAGIARDHTRSDAHSPGVAGDPATELAARDQRSRDTQPSCVAGGSTIVTQEVARDQSPSDAHTVPVAGDPTVPLRLAADSLFDIEQLRIATENRIRSLHEMEGWGATPAAGRWGLYLDSMRALETTMAKELVQALRAHPLGPWVRRTVGIGEKQGGRLIALLGDPTWNYAEDRPRRGPAELWAYCGYVPGQRRRRGERSNWNAEAKMRAFLCAESCVKARTSPYRPVYDAARVKHADAVHTAPCPQCGPAGHPAEAGSLLNPGHQHARALREVAKAILRDLWREGRRLQP